jgi:hypothetical protein
MWNIPASPAIVHMDELVIDVAIAGTNPFSPPDPADRVEVEQEGGLVVSAGSADATVRFDRRSVPERVRVRWLRDGVAGPWSRWTVRVRVCVHIRWI